MAILGKIIREARKSRGKSQDYLANLIGRDQTYISKLEKGKLEGGIKGDELLKIAEVLGYNPYVFTGEISLEDGDLTQFDVFFKNADYNDLQHIIRLIKSNFPNSVDIGAAPALPEDKEKIDLFAMVTLGNSEKVKPAVIFIDGVQDNLSIRIRRPKRESGSLPTVPQPSTWTRIRRFVRPENQ